MAASVNDTPLLTSSVTRVHFQRQISPLEVESWQLSGQKSGRIGLLSASSATAQARGFAVEDTCLRWLINDETPILDYKILR
jgi:hypothetical protein